MCAVVRRTAAFTSTATKASSFATGISQSPALCVFVVQLPPPEPNSTEMNKFKWFTQSSTRPTWLPVMHYVLLISIRSESARHPVRGHEGAQETARRQTGREARSQSAVCTYASHGIWRCAHACVRVELCLLIRINKQQHYKQNKSPLNIKLCGTYQEKNICTFA